jgi:integrase
VASISLGYDDKGKRRRRTIYGSTKAEVLEKLRQLQNDASNGVLPEVQHLTVAQFLHRWLNNTTKPKVSPTTFNRYEQHVRLHINPSIGGVRLNRLTALHVEQLYADMERNKATASERQKVGKTLRQSLRHAVEVNLLPNNPAAKVPLPKVAKREMKVYDGEQVVKFLKAASTDRLYAMYVLALDSGMRQGELFGLQWSVIDFEKGSVSVQRSLEEVKGKHRLKEVKTAKGRRRIELSQFTLDVLHDHRKRMLAEGFTQGVCFCDTDGGPLRKSNVARRSFQMIMKQASLPAVRFHDLRHTAATLLLLQGIHPKVVSERLGHASIELTLNT